MRILQLVGRSHRRGAEVVALELAHELEALGHESRFAAIGLGHDGGRDPALPPVTHQRTTGPRAVLASVVPLRRLIVRDRIDLVLAHGAAAAGSAALARRRDRPLVVWQRILGFPPEAMRAGKRHWLRFIASRTDAVVALTTRLAEETRELGFLGPVWLIGNSRNPERFVHVDRRKAQARLRAETGVAPDLPLIGFVGHLVPQKRPERALDVLEGVLARNQPAHLVIAGPGPLRTRLEKEVAERGLISDVTLLGHRSDIETVYGGVELVVLTSDSEGIPGVALEALLTGCPVVTFPLGGVGAVVENGKTGIVLDRPDTGVMADHVVQLLRDPECRHQLGAEGRRRADAFSMRRAANEYSERFVELTARIEALTGS